jgi:hypothetical protein
MLLEQLVSQVQNNVVAGAKGITINQSFSLKQIENELISEYLTVMREYTIKGILPKQDFYRKLSCVETYCGKMEECCEDNTNIKGYNSTDVLKFDIPELITDFGTDAVAFVGSADLQTSFSVYFSSNSANAHKFKMRGSDRPFVYIEPATLNDGMITGYLYGAPLTKIITVIAMFKDPRKLAEYDCCPKETDFANSFVATEVVKRLTEKYLRYYRQFATPITPSNLQPK